MSARVGSSQTRVFIPLANFVRMISALSNGFSRSASGLSRKKGPPVEMAGLLGVKWSDWPYGVNPERACLEQPRVLVFIVFIAMDDLTRRWI